MPTQSFRELVVWQRAMELVKAVYRLTEQLPDTERFGLTSQIRRCAISIPSNIAEGRQRRSRKEFAQFLRIADGSAAELETQLILASDLYTLQNTAATAGLLAEVQKMLGAILKKL